MTLTDRETFFYFSCARIREPQCECRTFAIAMKMQCQLRAYDAHAHLAESLRQTHPEFQSNTQRECVKRPSYALIWYATQMRAYVFFRIQPRMITFALEIKNPNGQRPL